MGRKYPGRFYVHLQDSQVSLAALVKGGLASSSLNERLRCSIPQHVTYRTRAFYGFVDSAQNPADDPTRLRRVRTPDRPYPKWLEGLSKEKSERFEEMLQENGVHPKDTTDLPPERELLAEPFAPGLRKIEEKRLMRKQKPKKKRILEAEAEGRGAEDREAKKDADEASSVREKGPEERKFDPVEVETASVDGATRRGEG